MGATSSRLRSWNHWSGKMLIQFLPRIIYLPFLEHLWLPSALFLYYSRDLTEGRCMVGSDKLPTAALGLDVRGAAAATRWRAGAKASAAWAQKFGFKGKRCWLGIWKVEFFHGWGGKRMWYVKNLKAHLFFWPSGTVTKEEIHIRRAKGQNKRAINTKNVKHQIPWRVCSRLSSKALPRECIGSSHQLPFVRNHKLVSGSTDFSHFANYSITTQGIPLFFFKR